MRHCVLFAGRFRHPAERSPSNEPPETGAKVGRADNQQLPDVQSVMQPVRVRTLLRTSSRFSFSIIAASGIGSARKRGAKVVNRLGVVGLCLAVNLVLVMAQHRRVVWC